MNETLKNLFDKLNLSLILDEEFSNAKIIKAEYFTNQDLTLVSIENDYIIPLELYIKIDSLLKETNLNISFIYKTSTSNYSESTVLEYFRYFIEKTIVENSSLFLKNIYLDFYDNDLKVSFPNDGLKMMFTFQKNEIENLMKHAGFNISYLYEIDEKSILDSDIDQVIKEEENTSTDIFKKSNKSFNNDNVIDYDQLRTSSKNVNISKIVDLYDEYEDIYIEGYVFNEEIIKTKTNRHIQTIKITDYTDSIIVKRFENNKINKMELDKIKEGMWISVQGDVKYDRYANEHVLFAKNINVIKSRDVIKYDTSNDKRVELHLHTNMSTMDGISSPKEYLNQALLYGHNAVAFTDFNNVQAYPEIYHESLQSKIKVLYGMESNLIENNIKLVFNESNQSLIDSTFVYFDFETTGFNPETNNIIEIGAVKYKNGMEIDRFQSFVKINERLSLKIKTLTNISDFDVADAPTLEKILPDFISFYEDAILVAHNASFDLGFLNKALEKLNYENLKNAVIDTLELSKFLDKKRKLHRLGNTARAYGVNYDENTAHRADYDALVLAEIFEKMKIVLSNQYNINTIEDINKLQDLEYLIKQRANRCSILCLNENGLKDLFKLVSIAHTENFSDEPKLFKKDITNKRENLLIGSGNYFGEIYQKINSENEEKIKEIIAFYDYIEIVPPSNLSYLIDKEEFKNLEEIQQITKYIISLAKSMNKIVVAIGDVYYNLENQKEYRDVYISAKGIGGKAHYLRDYKNRIKEYPNQHFRTTNEMLEEFSFLGEELAFELVVTNTNLIADKISDDIKPIKDKLYTPHIEGVDDLLIEKTYETAYAQYGNPLPKIVKDRIEKELNSIIQHGFAVVYYISSKLVEKSLNDGYLVGSRGSVGSSLVATMTNITEVNPLIPHYYCPNCQYSEFIEDKRVSSGYDLEDKVCPKCGSNLKGDGQDIPFETFLGFEGDKVPDIDLNFSSEYQNVAHEYTKEIFGEDYVFRAGTISTVQNKTAFGYARGYHELKQTSHEIRSSEYERLAKGCEGVKRTTGQHPGGIIVIPDYMDVHDFTPINYPADDLTSSWKTTHFDFHAIHDNVLKFDILGHVDPTAIRMLQDLTGVDPKSIPTNDKKVLSLFSSNDAIGISHLVNYKNAAIGIPEFGTQFVRSMLDDTTPNSFAELVQISGLSHGTDVWVSNSQDLIKRGICTLSEVIGCRDDIMVYLMKMNIEPMVSFNIMESVRKGKGLKEEWISLMRANNVPQWYIDSCQKIKYMFPKAHAVAYVLMAFRVAWFKVYYPLEYYATYFSTRCDQFEIETMILGIEAMQNRILEINEKGFQATAKEKALISVFEVSIEMYLRGYIFLPIDIDKSLPTKYVIDNENNALIPSLISIDGLGLSVANKMIEARSNSPFLSKEDFETRGQLNKNQLAILNKIGSLKHLDDSNQLSLF